MVAWARAEIGAYGLAAKRARVPKVERGLNFSGTERVGSAGGMGDGKGMADTRHDCLDKSSRDTFYRSGLLPLSAALELLSGKSDNLDN